MYVQFLHKNQMVGCTPKRTALRTITAATTVCAHLREFWDLDPKHTYELESKLLSRRVIWGMIWGTIIGLIKGDLDYSSYGSQEIHRM